MKNTINKAREDLCYFCQFGLLGDTLKELNNRTNFDHVTQCTVYSNEKYLLFKAVDEPSLLCGFNKEGNGFQLISIMLGLKPDKRSNRDFQTEHGAQAYIGDGEELFSKYIENSKYTVY